MQHSYLASVLTLSLPSSAPQEPLLWSHPKFRNRANYGTSTWGKYFPKGGTVATLEAAAYDAKQRHPPAATAAAATAATTKPPATARAAATALAVQPLVGKDLVGRKMGKQFLVGAKRKTFAGTVKSFDAGTQLYAIAYADGDDEDLSEKELLPLLKKKKTKTKKLNLRNDPPPRSQRTSQWPDALGKKAMPPTGGRRKATANCSDTTRKSARTGSSASWPSELGALVGISTGHGSRRPLSTCCVCGERCETVYKCNGCGLDLHVVCGLKDERPGSTSSQAWCQNGSVTKKCYPPGKCPDHFHFDC